MTEIFQDRLTLARRVARRWLAIDGVVAVVLGGSLGRIINANAEAPTDIPNDIDLYAYTDAATDPAERLAAIKELDGENIELQRQFWEEDDSWRDAASGHLIEVMYRSTAWSEDEVARRLDRHEAAIGYTTSVVDNISDAIPLEDPTGWFERLQGRTRVPYPVELQRAILNKNWPVLRTTGASLQSQLVEAMERDDVNAEAHRTVAILASLWDILFALNGAYHPGEKRLVIHAMQRCPIRPPDLDAQIRRVLATDAGSRIPAVDHLLDSLDACIIERFGTLPPYVT